MIGEDLIPYLKLAHGFYNTLIMLLFVYQAILGLKIRRQRIKEKQQFHIVKKHRRLGTFLVPLVLSGFLTGLIVVFLDTGRFLKHPIHFAIGLSIVLSIITTFFISRKIKGIDLKWRDIHFRLGIIIIFLFITQIFIGLWMLFIKSH